jgi:hypothetical protein
MGELAELDRELRIPFSHQRIDKIVKDFDRDRVNALNFGEKTDKWLKSRSMTRFSFVSRPQIMTVIKALAAEWEHLFYDLLKFYSHCRTFLC